MRAFLMQELLPLLSSIYGEGVYGHLGGLARESKLCAELVDGQA